LKTILKRYAAALVAAAVFIVFLFLIPAYRDKATGSILFQTKTMLLLIPPIFILLGLLDVWVPKEKMIRFMGPGSGLRGGALAFFLGSFAAGPLYGAFPLAAVLMKKGANFTNIMILIGAWSTTKIPMLLFEMAALGKTFALVRLAIDIPGIILIAFAIKATLPAGELKRIYDDAGKRE
jgi:uncharacterized membrane protein YraQ (UPF0718 family)